MSASNLARSDTFQKFGTDGDPHKPPSLKKGKVHLKIHGWRRFAYSVCLGSKDGNLVTLFAVGVLLVFLGALSWSLTGGNADFDATFADSMWISWGLFFDPGTQTGLAADETWPEIFVGIFFSICGFLFNMVFLGIMVDRTRDWIDQYEKVHSRAVRTGHTVVLGWTEKTLFLLSELLHQEKPPKTIVVLSKNDPNDLTEEVDLYIPANIRKHTELIFREGDIRNTQDIYRTGIEKANKTIVLGDPGVAADESDQGVLQTVMAALGLQTKLRGNIIAEMRDSSSLRVLDGILKAVSYTTDSKKRVQGVIGRDLVDEMMVISTLSPEIGNIYQELIRGSKGQGLHLFSAAPYAGDSFDTATRRFRASMLIGVIDHEKKCLRLSPSNYTINASDKLVLFTTLKRARARSTLQVNLPYESTYNAAPADYDAKLRYDLNDWRHSAKKIAILNCGEDMVGLLQGFDRVMFPGSTIFILGQDAKAPDAQFKNVTVQVIAAKSTVTTSLAKLPEDIHNYLILAPAGMHTHSADTASFTTMVLLKEILAARNDNNAHIVCELLDASTEKLMEFYPSMHVNFFHSNMLEAGLFSLTGDETATELNVIKCLMAPKENDEEDIKEVKTEDVAVEKLKEAIADDSSSAALADEKVAPRDTLICLVSINVYIKEEDLNRKMRFWELHERVRARGEVLLGFTQDGKTCYNPSTDAKVRLTDFTAECKLLVLQPATVQL